MSPAEAGATSQCTGSWWVDVCPPWIPVSPTCPSQTSPKLGCSCVLQPKRDRTSSPPRGWDPIRAPLASHRGDGEGWRGKSSARWGGNTPDTGIWGVLQEKGQSSAQTPAARGRPGCSTLGAFIPLMHGIFVFPFASASCRPLPVLQAWRQRLSVLPASWDVTL